MSHGIESTDHLAYFGQTPWHGLGTPVMEDISIPDMLEAAKLTWEIGLTPMFYELPDGEEIRRYESPRKAMYRTDTRTLLDVVGPGYVPTQNAEALAFFEEYLATGSMKLNVAGSLFSGRYVWGLAKLKTGFTLPGGDEVQGYLLVANANQYGKGLIVKFVVERVVCHNTLTMALNESGRQVTIPHIRVFDKAAREHAKTKIGLAVEELETMATLSQQFAQRKLSDVEVQQVLGSTFRVPAMVEEEELTIKQTRPVKRVLALYEGEAIGAEMESAKGTSWGLLNAVTQYIDHEYGRGGQKGQDRRLTNSWFGGGVQVKARALKALKGLDDE